MESGNDHIVLASFRFKLFTKEDANFAKAKTQNENAKDKTRDKFPISTQSCLSLHSIQSLSTPKNQESCQNPFIKGYLDINRL